MEKEIIHVSAAEAARSFAELLAKVCSGAEVVIETDARAVAVVRPADPLVRKLSESLRLAEEHASKATLDGEFSADLEAIVNSHREPLDPPSWD